MDRSLYIKKLTQHLSALPKAEREDVLREIEQNIDDAVSLGENEATVLSRLGEPGLLAKAYTGDYYIKENKVLKSIPFFFFTGFSSIIIVPVLTFFAAAFGIGALGIIIAGILRTFGATGIPMYWSGKEAPQAFSLLFSIPASLIFLLISFLSWKILKSYFIMISNSHKKRIKI